LLILIIQFYLSPIDAFVHARMCAVAWWRSTASVGALWQCLAVSTSVVLTATRCSTIPTIPIRRHTMSHPDSQHRSSSELPRSTLCLSPRGSQVAALPFSDLLTARFSDSNLFTPHPVHEMWPIAFDYSVAWASSQLITSLIIPKPEEGTW